MLRGHHVLGRWRRALIATPGSHCACGVGFLGHRLRGWARPVVVPAAAPDLTDGAAPSQRRRRPQQQQQQQQQRRPVDQAQSGGAGKQQHRHASTTAPASGDAQKQRLSKVLAGAGVAARRASEKLIEQGVVKVNGQVVTSQVLVDSATDVIEVNGKKLDTSHIGRDLHYFALNKPKGYVCSNVEAREREGQGKRAVDLLQPWLDAWAKQAQNKGRLPPRLYTVGRLDVNTTGLIFVTNDGHWAQQVIHPSSNITKEYLMLVSKPPSRAQLAAMMRGVDVDGVHVAPEEVATLEETTRLRVVVKEGKKHEGAAGRGAELQAAGPSEQTAAEGPPAYDWHAASSEDGPEAPRPAPLQLPRYLSERLIVRAAGARVWVWSAAAWLASRALAARTLRAARRVHHLRDDVTGESWQAGDPTVARDRGRYSNGQPRRAPIMRWFRDQPRRPAPGPPTVLSAAQWRARAAPPPGSFPDDEVQQDDVLWGHAEPLGDLGSLEGGAQAERPLLDLAHKEAADWKVRLLGSAAGLEVLALKRVRIGGFRLPRTLKLGEYMALTPGLVKKVADARAEQEARAKESYDQRQPVQQHKGMPDPKALAAILEGAKPAAQPRGRPPRRPRT